MSDLISRRCLLAEIDDLTDEFSEVDENGLHSERWCGILDAKGVIVNVPSVADRPKGEWREERNWRTASFYSVCSECGYFDDERDDLTAYNFCPNCGADMRGEDNE